MAAAAAASSVDYGLDAPQIVRRMFSRGGWTLLFTAIVYYNSHAEYPGPAARMCSVLALIALGFLAAGWIMVWSSRTGKLLIRDQMLDALDFSGAERLLDVGTGRGLLAIGAAKRMKGGKVTGIDIWNPMDLSNNTADAAKENAKLEGVADRVRFDTCDASRLVYPDNHYDAVVSSLALHNITDDAARDQAVREIYRVLKPGGKLAIFDIFKTSDYAAVLREAGAKEVELSPIKLLWCLPSRVVTAKK